MDPKHHLEHTLTNHRFKNGQHRTTLILGAGLHHHLKALSGGGTTPSCAPDPWEPFTSWDGLIKAVAKKIEVPKPTTRLPATGVVKHGLDFLDNAAKRPDIDAATRAGLEAVLAQVNASDPAAEWEALVRVAALVLQKTAASAEKKALKAAAKIIGKHPATHNVRSLMGRGLRKYRDIINLNFDDFVQTAIKIPKPPATPKEPWAEPMEWSVPKQGHGRVWTPHAMHEDSDSMILGTWRYGGRVEGINTARKNAKGSEREHTPQLTRDASEIDHAAYLEKRRGDAQARGNTPIHWLDAILSSPVVIVGASMDRAEADLWYALHTRARNLARLPERDRKAPVFYLWSTTTGLSPHLRDRPADIIPVEFSTWDDAWDTLGLGLKP